MTETFFKDQMRRMRMRFGDRAFDNEFVLLVWREVKDMSEMSFQRVVDVMIGSRSSNKPPLLSEFREARINEEKVRFQNDVAQASRAMNWPAKDGLAKYLKSQYGSVKNINEAIEIERMKMRIKSSDTDPDGAA